MQLWRVSAKFYLQKQVEDKTATIEGVKTLESLAPIVKPEDKEKVATSIKAVNTFVGERVAKRAAETSPQSSEKKKKPKNSAQDAARNLFAAKSIVL